MLLETQVKKWGNSLALRIPKAFASELGLLPGTRVRVSLSDGRLVLEPTEEVRYTLQGLLHGVTDENRHEEVQLGPPRGREAL